MYNTFPNSLQKCSNPKDTNSTNTNLNGTNDNLRNPLQKCSDFKDTNSTNINLNSSNGKPRNPLRECSHFKDTNSADTNLNSSNAKPRNPLRKCSDFENTNSANANLNNNFINISNETEFINSSNGHVYLKNGKSLIELSNFCVSPKKIIIKDNGLYKEIEYILTCILENSEEKRTISISGYDLNSSSWINTKLNIKYYIGANCNTYELFKIYISKQFKNINPEIKYEQIGWRNINGKYIYLHGNGVIGVNNTDMKGSSDKKLEIDDSLTNIEALKLTHLLTNLSNDLTKTIPLFLYSHLSVLKELFVISGAEPKFVLWIYGLTGSMKTSVSKVFFNLFNRTQSKITATFKDTTAAVEMKAFEYKDSIILLDDYHPSTSYNEKKNMESLASNVLRMFGDGITKSRATKTMTKQKEFPPRGLCVITGEDKLGGESTVARYIGIEVSAGDYSKTDILSFHQRNPLVFSTHMHYFIEWVCKNFKELCDLIKEQFAVFRNNNIALFRHKRLAETYTIFHITSEIFLSYCENMGYLTSDEYYNTLIKWDEIIFNVIKTHENSNTEENPGIMYMIALQELILSKKCTLVSVDNCDSKKSSLIGYKDDEYYYLIPQTSFSEIKSFWKGQGIEFPISNEQVNKALDILGVIKTSLESGQTKRTVKSNPDKKGRKRYLTINIAKMNYILNNL